MDNVIYHSSMKSMKSASISLNGGKLMKTLPIVLIAAIAAVNFSSCSASRMANSDDVYYSSRDERASEFNSSSSTDNGNYRNDNNYDNTGNGGYEPTSNQSQQNSQPQNNGYAPQQNVDGGTPPENRFSYDPDRSAAGSQEQYSDGNGNTYITNNYYNDDDYYDYAYTARIRRFYHPYGWNYYDPFYTNLYWYDYNPYSWGVSLYCTYNWWNPRPTFGWGWGGGWGIGWGGGIGWGNPWMGNSPYWGNPWGGGWGGYQAGYWHGYNQGYWNGYYAGLYNGTFNPYYFNSLDNHSYYYGPRGGRTGIAGNTPGVRGGRTVGELYGRTLVAENPRNNSNYGIDGESAIGRPKRDIRSLDTRIDTRPSNASDSRGNVKDGIQPRDNNSRGVETINPRNNDGRDVATPRNEPGKSTGSDQMQPNTPRGNQDVVPGTRNNPVNENPRSIQPVNPRQDNPRETSPNAPRNPKMNAPGDNRPGVPGNTNPRSNEPSNPRNSETGSPRYPDTRTQPSGNPRGNEYSPAPGIRNEPQINAPRGKDTPRSQPEYNNAPRNESSPKGGEVVKPRGSSREDGSGSPRKTRRGSSIQSSPSGPSKSGGSEYRNPSTGGSRPSISTPPSGGSRGTGATPSGGSAPRRGR